MPNAKVSPNEARVAFIYERLTGNPMTRGDWDIKSRNFAQKIVHIEKACRSTLAAIEKLERCEDRDEVETAVQELRTEFRFLETLKDVT